LGGTGAAVERRPEGVDGFARERSRFGHGQLSQPSSGDGRGEAVLKGAGGAGIPGRFDADPATVDQGLAKLVLGLIEPFRRLLEKPARRRIDAGSPTDNGTERMGETIVRLERTMEELKATFGLADGDRNLNLGPPGDLL
jgi:hypothetical protein